MTITRTVIVHPDRDAVVSALGARIVTTLTELTQAQERVDLVLTGGTVGIDSLAAVADLAADSTIDWSRVHVWWGDERWLPAGDAERNDTQADGALLSRVALPASNIHRFAHDDGSSALDEAAAAYAAELAAHAPEGEPAPRFDILLLGVGPDGHVASLFPDRDAIAETATVVAVRESPKPPPERLSLTMPVICRADRVWLALAGADKASALSLALSDAHPIHVPVAGAHGRMETVFFVDADAAADVPADLIAENRP